MAYVTHNYENIGLSKNELEQYNKHNENEKIVTEISNSQIYQSQPNCPMVGSSGNMSLPVQLVAIPSGKELKKHMTNENLHAIEVEMEDNLFGGQRDQERKVRREIANSNERRRMQSINSGFRTLKTILPHSEGDKLSKATILQNTAEYIFQLESEKLKLLQQNERLKQVLHQCKCGSAIQKAALIEATEKDEGIGSPGDEDIEESQYIEVRKQLDKERTLRRRLEERIREMEALLPAERYSSNSSGPQKKQRDATNTRKGDVRNYISVALDKTQSIYNQPMQQPIPNPCAVQQSKVHPLHAAVINPSPQIYPMQSTQLQQTDPQYVSLNANPGTCKDVIPQPGLCITISGNEAINSPPSTKKPTVNNQLRSRQPLKKRMIDMTEQSSPMSTNKIAKFNVVEPPSNNVQMVISPPLQTSANSIVQPSFNTITPAPQYVTTFPTPTLPPTLILPKAVDYHNLTNVSLNQHEAVSVIQETQKKIPVHNFDFQTKNVHEMQNKNNRSIPQTSSNLMCVQENATVKLQSTNASIVSPHSTSLQGSYMSVSPIVIAQSQPSSLWKDKDQQQFPNSIQASTLQPQQNYQVAIAATSNENLQSLSSRYILPPPTTTQRVQPNAEEITLNQLHHAPSLSMTLTQLNTLPTVSRSTGVVVPMRNVHHQYLPLVTMDSVLRTNLRRLSNATTDSSPSDEDNRTETTEESHVETEAISEQKVQSPVEAQASPSSSVESTVVSSTATVSLLSSGPGSPPVIRHIDKVATRRNLETIVQAIDHLEQQERRNSQDQQSGEESEASSAKN